MEPETETEVILKECVIQDGKEFCRVIEGVAEAAPAIGEEATATDVADTGTSFLSGVQDRVQPIIDDPVGWAETNILQPEILYQIGAIFGVLFIGILLTPFFKSIIMGALKRLPEDIFTSIDETTPRLIRPALWVGGMMIAQTALAGMGRDGLLVEIAVSLATAWLVIRLATTFLPDGLRAPITWIALGGAVLNSFGVLGDLLTWSATVGPEFGGRKISPPFIVQAVITAGMFLFAASWLSKKLKTRVASLPKVEPSIRILMGHALQIGLFFAAAMFTLAGLGIPLAGLTVLGGAVGIGLGFGMQQIVANFISGVILLTDRSIKPNDVIEVDDTYGVVKSLGLRYASVITRDGTEHLIPNEMLITDKVINWSFSNTRVRIKRTLQVDYESDIRQAIDLVVRGVSSCPRVLKDPAPKCQLKEFGDDGVILEARFWISDPHNGVGGIGSEAMLAVWDLFKEAGLDMPMRHEDVLITPGSTIKVQMVPGEGASANTPQSVQIHVEKGDKDA